MEPMRTAAMYRAARRQPCQVALAELRAGAAGIHTTAFTSVTNSGGCRAQQCRAAEAPLLEHPVDVRTGIWALAAVRAVWAGGNRSERRVAAAAAEAPRASAGLHTSATRAMAQPLSGEGGLQPPPEWAEGTAVDPSNVVPEYSTVDWRRKIGPPLATLKQRVANKGERRAKWVKDAEQFRTVFPRLVEYRRVFGDCKVPRNYRYDFQLGDLVHSKRNLHKHDQLPAYQRKWLTAIKFKFEHPDKLEAQWHFMLHELRAFRDRYGHADPPDGFLEPANDLNPDLVGWVNGARKLYQKGKMLPRFERRFRQLDCTLGEMPESIASVKRSVFDPELGVPLQYDPATGLWSYQAQRGRTSRRANLRTLLELHRQGVELRHSTGAAPADEA